MKALLKKAEITGELGLNRWKRRQTVQVRMFWGEGRSRAGPEKQSRVPDAVGFLFRAPFWHLDVLTVKWWLDYSQLGVEMSLSTSLIIISLQERRSTLNTDCLYGDGQPAVLRQTAASLCHFLSEIPDDEAAWSRPLTANPTHVAAQSFHCLGKKTEDSARPVLLNSHLAWGADVLWHGAVDACLFG